MATAIPERDETAVRDRLLTAALELFRDRGYAATSVREIVERAGVTKPVLYYWFGSKEGIYLHLMEETSTIFRGMLADYSHAPGAASERIRQLTLAIFDAFLEKIDIARLIYAIFFGPPQGAPEFPHEQYFDRMLETFGGLVREGIAAGELAGDPEEIAWGIIASLNIIMEEQLCTQPPRIGRDGVTRLVSLVLRGAAPGGSR